MLSYFLREFLIFKSETLNFFFTCFPTDSSCESLLGHLCEKTWMYFLAVLEKIPKKLFKNSKHKQRPPLSSTDQAQNFEIRKSKGSLGGGVFICAPHTII